MTLPTTDLEVCNMALSHIGETDISSLTADESKSDRECNRFYSSTVRELQELFTWGASIAWAPLELVSGYEEYNDVYDYDAVSITGITQASPAVVTAASHGLSSGDFARISDVEGMDDVNRELPYTITKIDANSFSIGIDTTNWDAYTSGGEIIKMQPKVRYADGYTYALPDDYVLAIGLESRVAYEIRNSQLVCLDESPVLEYIKSETDVSNFTALFVHLISLRLALKICVKILGLKNGLKMKAQLWEEYKIALDDARGADASEINEPGESEDSWLKVRR